ncbi:spore gernimation protein [Mesobacillus boroniphilus]|uniref:Spore gernimation protein n=1 Tax=Mesobacillus boroniphilus TaxID=308892 RepID=A0A944CQJ4_9BACI|nr:endospore germination permease [Mesobacillus boroniphilus]MBS8267072.1 spore gernimation protein [Mesobacillus boroniphilus]
MENLIKILIPRQLFLLLILSTGLLNHVILIPNLLSAAGRDSWLSVLLAYPISLVFLWLIYFIVKRSPNEGFFFMIRERFGKIFSIIFSIPIIFFLFASAYVTLRDLMIWLNAYFLADTSIFIINLMLIFACMLVSLAGIKYMAISSGFILPLVMIFGIFISITNTSLKDPALLFPLLADGYFPVIKGMLYALSGLLEIYLVILLQPFSQSPIKFKQLFILLTILTGLILGPLTASLMEFGPVESVNYRYPAFEQWRVLSIGEYISHLDFFALYQWLSGALIRIGLFMYMIGLFFTDKKKHYRLNPKLIIALYLILFGIMTLNFESHYFYMFVFSYFLPASMFLFMVQIISSALILLFLIKRDERHGKNNKLESSS